MDPINQIKMNYESLSKTEQRVASLFLQSPNATLQLNLTDVAKKCSVSNAAVIRMCQKLGYNGFAEFKFSNNRYLLSQGSSTDEEYPVSDLTADPQQQIINTYIQYMNMLPEFVSHEQLSELAQNIIHARRLSIWGINRTAQSAMQLSNRLTRLGIYNKMSQDSIIMVDDSNILSAGDLCILISLNGRGSTRYPQLLTDLKQRGCATWLITMNPKIKAAKTASRVITLPWISHANQTNFFEDQIIVYLFIELLLYETVRQYPNSAAENLPEDPVRALINGI